MLVWRTAQSTLRQRRETNSCHNGMASNMGSLPISNWKLKFKLGNRKKSFKKNTQLSTALLASGQADKMGEHNSKLENHRQQIKLTIYWSSRNKQKVMVLVDNWSQMYSSTW